MIFPDVELTAIESLFFSKGVGAVRSLGHTLASMQKFQEVTPEDNRSDAQRSSPGTSGTAGASSNRRRSPAAAAHVDEDFEEIVGASGGASSESASGAGGVAMDALWLDFDADEMEEQFLLSADLEKTKKERKPP